MGLSDSCYLGCFITHQSLLGRSGQTQHIYLQNKHRRLLPTVVVHSPSPTHIHTSQYNTNKHQPPESILHVSKTVSTLCPVISTSYTVLTADLAKTQTADKDRWFLCVFSHISEQEASNLAAAGSRGSQIKSQKVRKFKQYFKFRVKRKMFGP